MADGDTNRTKFAFWIAGTIAIVAIAVSLLLPQLGHHSKHPKVAFQRAEIIQLIVAIENFRATLGHGRYPPSSNDDPDAVASFLATAFPNYHGGLPEKYKNLDPATSLAFWLGGVTDQVGKPIGFSSNPENPFDATDSNRIPVFYEFDPQQLRLDGGLPVILPDRTNKSSDPFVYFCPDANGIYHGQFNNCRPCRDSSKGGWINPKTYQLFGPGLDGKYGSGVQYPSGVDYDGHRKDDMSNFTYGATLDDDM